MITKGKAIMECESCGYREIDELPLCMRVIECPKCTLDTFYLIGIEDEEYEEERRGEK